MGRRRGRRRKRSRRRRRGSMRMGGGRRRRGRGRRGVIFGCKMNRSSRNRRRSVIIRGKLVVVSLGRSRVKITVWKVIFIEDDMPRYDDSLCEEVKTLVSLMIRGRT